MPQEYLKKKKHIGCIKYLRWKSEKQGIEVSDNMWFHKNKQFKVKNL